MRSPNLSGNARVRSTPGARTRSRATRSPDGTSSGLLLEQRSVGNRPVPDVLEIFQHEAAFRGILAGAGSWRRVNVGVTGARFTPPRTEKVGPMIEEWEKEYAGRDLRTANVFALGAWMHFQFETVHPFEGGNGRVGRILLNLHFLRHNWPPIHVLPPDRRRYLKALDAVHPDLGAGAGYHMPKTTKRFALETEGRPSKWITLTALQVLKRVEESSGA